nr:MAG TPA: minor capsid protein [Microviridae sp.]
MWEAIANAAGSLIGGAASLWEGGKSRKLQKEAMQNGIQWRVADAQKAGVHPLYALGAPTFSPSPVVTGAGDALSSMGQNVGRALNAGSSRDTQLSAFDVQVQDLTLKKFGLENELLASQIARMNQETLSKPAIPAVTMPSGAGRLIPGQSSTAQVVQDQYGDVVENVYGMWRLLNDAAKNIVGPGKGVRRPGAVPARGGYLGGKVGN